MPRWSRGEPRPLPLQKSDKKRITTLLSALPVNEPEIAVVPADGHCSDIYVREAAGRFVPLEVGAQAYYADYDVAGRIEEASFLTVPRRVRVCRMWTLEAYEAMGFYIDDQLTILAYRRNYYRVDSERSSLLDPDAPDLRDYCPRRLTEGVVQQVDSGTLNGPNAGKMLLVGCSAVSVDGRQFQCARVLNVWREPEDPSWDRVDDVYINQDGRTVLCRTYVTTEFDAKQHEADSTDEVSTPLAPQQLIYNAQEFRRWFDTLTDVALGGRKITDN